MDMLSLVSGTGVALKKVAGTHGGEYAGPCPGCGGKDRFRCWPEDKEGKGSFWCRQCGKGGDDIQFMVEFMGYTYRQAFDAAGRSMPENYTPAVCRPARDRQKKTFEPQVFESPADLWRERALKFVEKAHETLLENEAELSYLARRGLDLQAVKGFRLGWFEGENGKGCMFRSRESWGLETVLKKNGKKKVLWIPRGIVIPTFKGGKIYRVRVRRPSEDLKTENDARYFIVPGSGMEVAGHNPEHRAFVVVEADLDEMMVCRRAGSLVGTVALGSSGAKPGADVFPVLQKALRVLVALDWDAAGRKAWTWWEKNFSNARQWPVPIGKDPGESFEKGVDIREWVVAGLPPVLTMDTNRGYVVPEGVPPMEELHRLLSAYPVKILADKHQAKVEYDPGFRNRAIRQRINELFFGEDDEVYWYLRYMHPDSVITKENFWVQFGDQ